MKVTFDQTPAGFKAEGAVCQLELHQGAEEPGVGSAAEAGLD